MNQEVEEYVRRCKVITGWSCESGMGVNTFMTAAAIESAKRGIRTALVELDLFHASTAVTLGMSHKTRNLESWLGKAAGAEKYREIKDYLLNSNIWSQEMSNERSDISDAVSDLPQELYLFTPSQHMDRFEAASLRLKADMPYHIIKELDELGFQAVFIDLPSEILMPGTSTSMKLADEVLVFTDGQVSHNLYTLKELKRMEKDVDSERIKLILNRAPQMLAGVVEGMLDRKVWLTIPDDPSIIQRSLDLIPGGGEDYNNVVKKFCDQVGLIKRKKASSLDSSMEGSQNESRSGGFFNFLRRGRK